MDIQQRNAEILRRWDAGESGDRIAETFGITQSRISQIARAAGRFRGRGWMSKDARRIWSAKSRAKTRALCISGALVIDPARDQAIFDELAKGLSYSRVAEILGLDSRNVVAGAVYRAKRREALRAAA